MAENTGTWKLCSACKKPIGYGTTYWVCSVSTCNRHNTSFAFCSVPCWDSHLPIYKHRNSWAEERKSPERGTAEPNTAAKSFEEKRPTKPAEPEREILIVASKLKDYIRKISGMNTSGAVLDVLSEIIRAHCDRAIEKAKQAGRSTVMDRDF